MTDWHITPVNDLREHLDSRNCWCRPTRDEECPWVWVHHSLDRREDYEDGTLLLH